jgi:hypothetical protein
MSIRYIELGSMLRAGYHSTFQLPLRQFAAQMRAPAGDSVIFVADIGDKYGSALNRNLFDLTCLYLIRFAYCCKITHLNPPLPRDVNSIMGNIR